MGGDLRQQLAAALPQQQHKLIFFEKGSKHPPYNDLSLADALKKFAEELVGASPILDPRNKRISIVKQNFPKLAGLQHLKLCKAELSASDIIAAIENGALDIGEYDPTRDDRLRTLFWIPEVISNPDAIYRNGHKIVAGDEVYVRVYDKMGSTVKLIFTMDIKKNGRTIRTVPITSFLTNPGDAMTYVSGNPLYRRQ